MTIIFGLNVYRSAVMGRSVTTNLEKNYLKLKTVGNQQNADLPRPANKTDHRRKIVMLAYKKKYYY